MLNEYSTIIAIVALVVSIISLLYTWKSNRRNDKQRYDEMQDELDSINHTYFNGLTSHIGLPEKMQMEARKNTLEKQLRRRKK